jgi:hypothetical protein
MSYDTIWRSFPACMKGPLTRPFGSFVVFTNSMLTSQEWVFTYLGSFSGDFVTSKSTSAYFGWLKADQKINRLIYNTYTTLRCCGSPSPWCGSGSCFSLWCGSGSGSYLSIWYRSGSGSCFPKWRRSGSATLQLCTYNWLMWIRRWRRILNRAAVRWSVLMNR